MILVDFNQIAYACILDHLASTKQADASVPMVRAMMLNTLRANVRKFKSRYGEVVIAYDSKTYWRTEQFPHYKAKRKSNRAKSQFNWAGIFTCLDTLCEEFKVNLMYKVLQVDGAEADDIIGYLSHVYGPSEKIMIISGDKDFIQLQVHPNVEQYSPLIKKQIVDKFPKVTLKQQIIRGDTDDGVPNILSPDDVFVSGGRQSPIMEKKLIGWINTPVEEFCNSGDMLRNYRRNEKLIDLKEIPVHIKQAIGHAYDTAVHPNRGHFLNYLAAAGLKDLTESVGDF
jgi:hypothetical protein